jgi:outer membrane lipoprotein carrier protein
MRILITAFAAAVVVSACSRDPQPAAEPQPAPPAGAETGMAPGALPGDPDGPHAPASGAEAVPQPEQPRDAAGPGAAAPEARPGAPAAETPAPGGAPEPAAPQGPDTQARAGAAVLLRAAAAYANVRALRADFVMNFENPLLRQRVTSRGTIYQRQPDRIALRFSDPEGDLIVGDGRDFWVYYPSNNAQQVIRAPAAAAGESAVNLQAQFIGDPVERFHYTLDGMESVAGRTAHMLTLVPRQRAEYRSLRVWIDERDALARRFEITEHNGTVRRFDLSNLQVNPSIPDTVFQFTPPEGVRVISAG